MEIGIGQQGITLELLQEADDGIVTLTVNIEMYVQNTHKFNLKK
jgi:hypothetical protein